MDRLAVLRGHLAPHRCAAATAAAASSTGPTTGGSEEEEAITAVEFGVLRGTRPRSAGRNARLDEHGVAVAVPIVRLTTSSGATGFGRCKNANAPLEAVLGMHVGQAFKVLSASAADDQSTRAAATGLAAGVNAVEYALLDLLGKLRGVPVYQLAAEAVGATATASPAGGLRVPAYDTSLYIDDTHLPNDREAAELMASEAMEGYNRGHRAFKIKTGRGARWMDLEAGTARDIEVIKAVRNAVGPECPIMIDANNGYNLAITKRVLAETRDVGVYWVEEAFHEDSVLYDALRDWLNAEGIACLIADGEGAAHPSLVAMATNGPLDVVQYDIFSYGFMAWVTLGPTLDAAGVLSAPHHYGAALGNFYSGHLTGAIQNFSRVEWDEVSTPGIDASAYSVDDGYVRIPDVPGFGLVLDDAVFRAAVQQADGGRSFGKPL
jgi:L-rhamnonate dehydratase